MKKKFVFMFNIIIYFSWLKRAVCAESLENIMFVMLMGGEGGGRGMDIILIKCTGDVYAKDENIM